MPVAIIANDYDSVKAGFGMNLRRPGGNETGVFLSQLELAANRLEFMRAIVPAAVRYLLLGDAGTKDQLDATQQAVRQLRVEIALARLLIRHIGTGGRAAFAAQCANARLADVETCQESVAEPKA